MRKEDKNKGAEENRRRTREETREGGTIWCVDLSIYTRVYIYTYIYIHI